MTTNTSEQMTVDDAFRIIARDGRVLRLVLVRSSRGDSYLSLTMRAFPLPKPTSWQGPEDRILIDAARWLTELPTVDQATGRIGRAGGDDIMPLS